MSGFEWGETEGRGASEEARRIVLGKMLRSGPRRWPAGGREGTPAVCTELHWWDFSRRSSAWGMQEEGGEKNTDRKEGQGVTVGDSGSHVLQRSHRRGSQH